MKTNASEALSLYARLTGRNGGQTLIGGTGANENLGLQSNSSGTPGYVELVPISNIAPVSYATQVNSETLSFRTRNWNGSIETLHRFNIYSLASGQVTERSDLMFAYDANNVMRFVKNQNIYFYCTPTSYWGSTIAGGTPSYYVLNNTNTTVNNGAFIANQNGGFMTTGLMGFRNTSHSGTVGSADFELWLANGAAVAKVESITSAGVHTLHTLGTATSYATQGSSEVLAFENSMWNGSSEEKSYFTFSTTPSTTEQKTAILLKYGSTNLANFRSDAGANILYGQTTVQSSSFNITVPLASVVVKNTNSTVNNYESVGARNANSMTIGYLAFKNTDHSGTVGSADFSVWLANGAAATEKLTLTSAGLLGIGATVPTHALTFPSASTGIALYNTADQVTNYERAAMYWDTNVFIINSSRGGSGTSRALKIQSSLDAASFTSTFNINDTAGHLTIGRTTSGGIVEVLIAGGHSGTSGTFVPLRIAPTMTSSSTAAYTALEVDVTETAVGSGTKLLADFRVGSVSKVSIDNIGNITQFGASTAHYFGPSATDGTWRIVRSGNDLVIERREGGSYVTKSTITA